MLFDGVSVSDPGAAAAAAVLLLPNGRRYTVSQFLARGTEIEAEYTGLLIGLQKARQLGIKALEIKGDSDLVFHQVNGLAPIDEPDIQSLCHEIQTLMRSFERISLERISRGQNRPAVAAVNRCIDEALGKEKKPVPPPFPALTLDPDIAKLVQLGHKAEAGDYFALEARVDDYSARSLAELQEFVPEGERDSIALQWDGNDEHLAEIYRWYCRGLPAAMALKKVSLDNPRDGETHEKLPWEGELQTDSGEAPNGENSGDLSGPFLSTPLFEAIAETADPSPTPPKPDRFQPIHERPTLLSFQQADAGEPHGQTIPEINADSDPSKDTLPSAVNIQRLYETLAVLPHDERVLLVQQLVQSPDWVNIFLQAIAERVSDNR
jgi:ribonuclease HI